MKRIRTGLLLLILFPLQLFAQYKFYKDSTLSSPFSRLSGANSVNTGQFWDDPDYMIPLGFEFHLFGDTCTSLFLNSTVGLGGFLTTKPITSISDISVGIIAHGSDLVDRDTSQSGSLSPISVTTTGTAPNRICKIEWINAGFFDAIDAGNYNDSVNLQVWIYETTDWVEIRFGQGNYVSPAIELYAGGPGPWVGLFDSLSAVGNARMFYYLNGPVSAPALDSFTNINTWPTPPGMTGNPSSGMVYRFVPKQGGGVGLVNPSLQKVYSLHYQAGLSYMSIQNNLNQDIEAELLSPQGQRIRHWILNPGSNQCMLSDLVPGMYFIKIIHDRQQFIERIVR